MQKPYTSYNPWFVIPFLIWVVVGGILLLTHGDEQLFRFINQAHNSFLDVAMYYTTLLGEGVFITVVLLVLMGVSALRNKWYFSAAVLCNVIPSLVTQFIKHRVRAPRPLKFFNEAQWIHHLPDLPRLMENSFPSGHTCGAFGFFTFLSILLPQPYRKWGLLLFIIALAVGYSRIYLAVHFFRDVYVGSIIGAVFTMLVIALMNRFSKLFVKNK